MIITYDGFKQYAGENDLLQRWIVSQGYWNITHEAGADGVSSLSRSGTYRYSNQHNISHPLHTASDYIALSFDITTDQHVPEFIAGMSPAGFHDRSQVYPVVGVSLEHTQTSFSLMYRIPTSESGSANNGISIASIPALLPNTTYSIEIEVDHRDATAAARVWINGTLVTDEDLRYSRDRIENGFQSTSFSEVTLTSQSTTSRSRPKYSNILVYKPDAEHIAPVGPVDIKFLQAENAEIAFPPSDGTQASISDAAWTDFNIASADAGAEILGAQLHYRIAAIDGQDPALAEIALEVDGVQLGDVIDHVITPGFAAQNFTKDLPASSLQDITLKIRSAV